MKNQKKPFTSNSGSFVKRRSEGEPAKTPANCDYEIVYGAHSISEAIKSKRRKIYKIWTTGAKAFERVKPLLADYTVVQTVEREVLDKMTGDKNHLGIVGAASPLPFMTTKFDPTRNKRLLLLDGVVDVKNIGAILRSAFCTGFSGVCLVGKGNAIITPDVISTSAGLAQHLAIKVFPSPTAAVTEIKASGYQLICSVVSGGKGPELVDKTKPLCLVIGGEESGIGRASKDSGELVTLEQTRPDVCFNAAVAAGVLMYLLR